MRGAEFEKGHRGEWKWYANKDLKVAEQFMKFTFKFHKMLKHSIFGPIRFRLIGQEKLGILS